MIGDPLRAGDAPEIPVEPYPEGLGRQPWALPIFTDILDAGPDQFVSQTELIRRARVIEKTLADYDAPASVVGVDCGPAVSRFVLRPLEVVRRDHQGEEQRVKVRVSQIQKLHKELQMELMATSIRIEAPLPGGELVGLEVPNTNVARVTLRRVMESKEWAAARGPLRFGLGLIASGRAVVADLASMPHLLIAGATGSGKSACVHAILTSLLLTQAPDTLRLLLLDSKGTELAVYNAVPHLLTPAVVGAEKSAAVLCWAAREAERRLRLFAKAGVSRIDIYNGTLQAARQQVLPYIVVVIDELAGLLFSDVEQIEPYVSRLAEVGRAVGVHLVVTTQRPSSEIMDGAIKGNLPARIAFRVTSAVDSGVILNASGAEDLKAGEMLFLAPSRTVSQRLHACLVSEAESARLVAFWRAAQPLDTPP